MASTPVSKTSVYDQLIQLLTDQSEGLRLLQEKLERQKDHLIRFRVEDLEQSTLEISELTARVASIEKQRYELMETSFGRPDAKLKEVAREAPPEIRAILLELQVRLRRAARIVSRLGADNSDLMRNGADLVQGMLNLYQHAMNVKPLYNRESVHETAGIQGRMVNARL